MSARKGGKTEPKAQKINPRVAAQLRAAIAAQEKQKAQPPERPLGVLSPFKREPDLTPLPSLPHAPGSAEGRAVIMELLAREPELSPGQLELQGARLGQADSDRGHGAQAEWQLAVRCAMYELLAEGVLEADLSRLPRMVRLNR